MKKISVIATVIFCTLAFGLSAGAAMIENAKISPNLLDDGVKVSGNLNISKINVPLILTVEYNENIIAVAQTIASEVDESGKSVFEFEDIYFANDADSGIYEYKISGQYIDSPYVIPKDEVPYHVSAGDLIEPLKELNEAIEQKNEALAAQVFIDFEKELGTEQSVINNLSSVGKKLLYKFVMEEAFLFDEDDMISVNAAKNKFKQKYSRALSVSEYYSIANQSMLNSWIDKYESLYIQEGSKLQSEYYAQYKGQFHEEVKKLNNKRLSQDNFAVLETEEKTVKKLLSESILLHCIYKESGAVVKNIYDEFTEMFTPDKTYYNKLSSNQKGTVYVKMSGNSYSDSAAADKAFYDYSKSLYDGLGGSGSGNGGGSGSGGGTSSGSAWGVSSSGIDINTPGTIASAASSNQFVDLDSVSWAEEAINYLLEKRVVAGKGNGTFAPNDNVTRAEFAKMLVLVGEYDIPTEYESKFSDVTTKDWYSPYVEAARNSKLIMGDDNGNFRPDDEISREDVCVILARYLGYTGGLGITAPFHDIDNVSDYALEAVVYLYQLGIINGSDDGMFMPHKGATRAEAAKMIYEVLKKEA